MIKFDKNINFPSLEDKINFYHVLNGREERPIAAIIKNGVSSQDFEGEH